MTAHRIVRIGEIDKRRIFVAHQRQKRLKVFPVIPVGCCYQTPAKTVHMEVEGRICPKRGDDRHARLDDEADDQAEQIVYAFADPNCGYCNRYWLAARPFVESGQVQLRHLMVGIIGDDSPGKAAAILGAASPGQALASNERNYRAGGILPYVLRYLLE